jgi:hypothetical protein
MINGTSNSEHSALPRRRAHEIKIVKSPGRPWPGVPIRPASNRWLDTGNQQRAEGHVYRMAGVTEKVLPHLDSMPPNSVLDRVSDIEKYDRLARRNYGLSDNQGESSSLNLNILSGRGRTLIAIDQQATATPAQDEP